LTARTSPKDFVSLFVEMIAFAMGARISTLDDTDMSACERTGRRCNRVIIITGLE
jgi:hypothetical protein